MTIVSKIDKVLILCGLVIMSLLSCGKDDKEELTCSRESWLGVYSLTTDCDPGSYQGFDPLIITAGSGDNEILFNGLECTDQNGQPCNYMVIACDFIEHNLGDLTLSGELDGEIFTLNILSTNPNLSFSCTATYMKQ